MSCAKKAEYSDTCELNLRDNRKKTLIDQNIEGGSQPFEPSGKINGGAKAQMPAYVYAYAAALIQVHTRLSEMFSVFIS